MKCPECSFDNLSGSVYCQECGVVLQKNGKSKKTSSIRKAITEKDIDDIIFQPQRREGFWGRIFKYVFFLIVVGAIGLLLLMILVYVWDEENVTTMGSPTTGSTTTTQTRPSTFPIQQLEIQDLDAEWVNEQFYVKGILRNVYQEPARNIRVRIDFYKDEDLKQLFDTRFVTLVGTSAEGAYRFREPVYINEYDDVFWYTARIESAEFLE